MTQILVVDDSDRWRILVRSILERTSSFQVIGEACDGTEAIEKAVMLRPDVVLLDLAMPRLNGIEAARRIKQACPESEIVFVTQEDDREIRRTALETGAVAYVVKSTPAPNFFPRLNGLSSAKRRSPLNLSAHRENHQFSLGHCEVSHPAIDTHSQLRKDPNDWSIEAIASGKMNGDLAVKELLVFRGACGATYTGTHSLYNLSIAGIQTTHSKDCNDSCG